MLTRWRKAWARRGLLDEAYGFLFEEPPPDEAVSLDCETTSLEVATAQILSIGAVRLKGDTILAERPGWLILFKAEDRTDPPPPGWTGALPGRTLVELLVVDATTGALLLRPPAALFADFESIQLARHPALDRTRPLNAFGDAAP